MLLVTDMRVLICKIKAAMVTQVSISFAYGDVPLHTVVIWHKETLDRIQNGCYTRRVDTRQGS
jgi:hypothetical protein